MNRALAVLIAALLIPVQSIQLASAATIKPKDKNVEITWTQLTDSTQIWILGSQVHAYECLAKRDRGTLALKTSDGWMNVANSVILLDSKFCGKSANPFAAKFEFVLDMTGQQDFPGTHAKLLVYKISYPQGSRQGLAAVYDGSDEIDEDQNDGKLPSTVSESDSVGPAAGKATPKPIAARPSVAPSPTSVSNAGWRGCAFNEVPMFGRVKVVSVGGQFKVRIVSVKPELKVKGVKRAAKSCGEWEFVSGSPTFTVEIVRTGEDFTIALGAKSPGVSK